MEGESINRERCSLEAGNQSPKESTGFLLKGWTPVGCLRATGSMVVLLPLFLSRQLVSLWLGFPPGKLVPPWMLSQGLPPASPPSTDLPGGWSLIGSWGAGERLVEP